MVGIEYLAAVSLVSLFPVVCGRAPNNSVQRTARSDEPEGRAEEQ